tara:strand:- start:22180 stop:22353 length:174 start_codon:yes stop_codon:yes gene_type:complete
MTIAAAFIAIVLYVIGIVLAVSWLLWRAECDVRDEAAGDDDQGAIHDGDKCRITEMK